jgi:hypothetical protein
MAIYLYAVGNGSIQRTLASSGHNVENDSDSSDQVFDVSKHARNS